MMVLTVFVALLLTILGFSFIVYPFFRRNEAVAVAGEDEKLRELHSRRDTTYAMLKELEFDYQSGILTEEDYGELEKRYKNKAISVLKGLDELEKAAGAEDDIERQVKKLRQPRSAKIDDEIEKEILSLRRGKSQGIDDELEKEVPRLRQVKSKGRFCAQCGASVHEGDRFCSSCGARLRPGGQG